ncbi:MAG: FtsX-like permease family protein, partial [Lachnospiraceae bacterium]|nr:FtsX-like permease family protein [Lachnospiraceae bacterium]
FAAIYSVAELRAAFEKTMEIIWGLIVVMVVFAVILIVAVLYNSGSLSFHERVRELATLKVMGLSDGKIRSLLTIQNLWLSAAGIILGAPLANPLVEAMMNSNGENYDIPASARPVDYILGAAAVLLLSVLVSWMFSGRIRKLDMVGTLKGAE